jgi:hypothetical protein
VSKIVGFAALFIPEKRTTINGLIWGTWALDEAFLRFSSARDIVLSVSVGDKICSSSSCCRQQIRNRFEIA